MSGDISRYQKLYGQSLDGIILHDGRQIFYANDEAARILGAGNPAVLAGRSIYDFIQPYSRDIVRLRFGQILEEGIATPSVEDGMVRLDGSIVDTVISTGCIDGEDGRLVQVTFRDISDRKRLEKDLKLRKTELDRAQKIAHMGSWDWDYRLRRMYCSDEFFRILGLEPSGTAPWFDTLMSYIHPEDRTRVGESLAKARADMIGGKLDFRILTGDGKLKFIHMEGEVERDRQGNPVRVFGVFHDVTERMLAEAELKDAKAQAELYLDLMGHDINNMNQIAMGYLELAIDMVKDGGSIAENNLFLIEKPMDTLKSNSRLISNVRKVRGKNTGAFQPEIIDISGLLKSVGDEFAGIAGRHIEINITPTYPLRVRANELLKDVFGNLVGNAIKHSDPARPLTIDISASEWQNDGKWYYKIAIEDNGPGISDEQKKQLFNPVSLDKVRTSGKGLGLCLTDMLVRDFGGRLSVENRLPEDYRQGSRFIVTLPVAGIE